MKYYLSSTFIVKVELFDISNVSILYANQNAFAIIVGPELFADFVFFS